MEVSEVLVTAQDGCRLWVRVAGPDGAPLVVFHTGTPGSRYLYDGYLEACEERGFRIACCSRPGYGGSDRRPGRRYVDNAADTIAIADALGADRFYVAGHSGGGGPTLADASQHPERVLAAATLSTFAPRVAHGHGLDWFAGTEGVNGDEFRAIAAGDAALERFLRRATEEFLAVADEEKLREAFAESLSEADLNSLTGAFLRYQVESCPRAVEGALWGWFDDDKAIWGDWGFDLARIVVPVAIWQGGTDAIVPSAHGEWLASRIPGSRLNLLPDAGHFSYLATDFGAILDELIELGG